MKCVECGRAFKPGDIIHRPSNNYDYHAECWSEVRPKGVRANGGKYIG